MLSASCLDRKQLTVGYDDGVFYVLTGFMDDEDPGALVGEAFSSNLRVAQGDVLLVVLSPHENNFETLLGFERWDAEPPRDTDAWQEVCEAGFDVDAWGLAFSGTLDTFKLPPVPPGRYAARISGRGFVASGWPGSTTPGDEWRLQIWPVSERFSPRRIASWSAPEGPDC